MRAFIVLALIAAARADVGGYNYGAAVGSFPLGGHGGSNGAAHLSAPIGGGNAGNLGGPASNGGVGDFGSPLSAPVAAAAPAGPEFQKEFFTYQAPDAEFDDDKPLGDLSSGLKKNLRVVFIKGPENNGLSDAALQLAKHAGEQKTAIYVLQKQSDVSDLAQKLQNLNVQNTNKPEVHFVKYRTPEDAAHAQHAIQQQYNDLGGDSVSHDGGLAPVLNFASQSPAAPAAPSNAYIPPAAPASLPAPAAPAAPVAQSNTYIPPAAPSNTYIPPASQPEAPSNAYLPILKF
ncbi:uncharacterized protein LOC105664804 [Ceratitis capitata]|uniref:uncharacterized protein LOC105664804 n=1 Tax=Ceratitis capitata TaxID=7213 RepID=UPI00061883A1|nr:uncharacterized protein LOC105664804 [Ceratitis capitata]